jgi:hypothetical protein
MREESHLEEMRSAIRGDFERLKERRGDQELMRVAEDTPEPDALATADPEPVSEPEIALPESEPDEPAPEPQRSWLSRFLSA